MNRKLEITLVLIGIIAHIALYLSEISYNFVDTNYPDRANELGRGINIIFIVFSVTITGVMIGAISALLFRKNKKPKAASILLLIFSVISTMLTYGIGFLANIFYFIAGGMGIMRKPKMGEKS